MAEVRVAVGDPSGRQSTIWKILSHGDDVYVLARPLGGTFKTSLHRSGNYRHAWTSEAASKHLNPNQDRKIVGWQSPRRRAEDVRALLQIIIPECELDSMPGRLAPAGTVWLPAPPPLHLTNIWVVHSDAAVALETHPEMLERPTDLGKRWTLAGGDEVWILVSQAPMNDEERLGLEQQRVKLRPHGRELITTDTPSSGGRLRMVGMGAGGNFGVLWDLSAEFLRIDPVPQQPE